VQQLLQRRRIPRERNRTVDFTGAFFSTKNEQLQKEQGHVDPCNSVCLSPQIVNIAFPHWATVFQFIHLSGVSIDVYVHIRSC
jgi:hypothetical protein